MRVFGRSARHPRPTRQSRRRRSSALWQGLVSMVVQRCRGGRAVRNVSRSRNDKSARRVSGQEVTRSTQVNVRCSRSCRRREGNAGRYRRVAPRVVYRDVSAFYCVDDGGSYGRSYGTVRYRSAPVQRNILERVPIYRSISGRKCFRLIRRPV